MTIYLWIVWR